MSLDLSREVWDHAPDELTPAELVVLLAIAQGAQDHDRTDKNGRFWPARTWGDDIVKHTRMSPDSLRKVLQRLAKRGLECRVPLKYRETPSGRVPVFAYRGTATVYRLPVLTKPGTWSRLSSADGVLAEPSRNSRESNGRNTVRESRDESPRKPGPGSRPNWKNPKEPEDAASDVPHCRIHDERLDRGMCHQCRVDAESQWELIQRTSA